MQRLSGLDATFLYTETPTGHMHVAMTGVYDTASMQGGYSFEVIRDHIASRLHLIPPLRRRLVEVPFQLHHPLWIDDPHFDLDEHVHRIVAPRPGGRRELADITGQIVSEPLDRSRPLWEVWVVEELKHGRIGVITKVHHAAIDGASGAEIMTELFDVDPQGREVQPPPDSEEVEDLPSDGEMVAHALVSRLRRAASIVPLASRTVEAINNIVSNRRDENGMVGAVPLTAPRTPWNRTITGRRSVSFARFDLDEAKRVKNVFGVTLNDVVLATIAGVLRRYLDRHDELPDDPLVAVCPISVRTDDEAGTMGNKVSAMFVSLPTQIDDPVERLKEIALSTVGAKTEHNALGARLLTDWGEFAAPRTFALASRLYASLGLADRVRPIHNLVISNVPGPPFPLYMAGAQLIASYPMGPIMEGVGLNATVMSYETHIDVGFMASRELIPDVWQMAADVPLAFAELLAAANAVAPVVVPTAKPQRKKRAPAAKKKAPAT